MPAPILLFTYNRPWHTQQTLDALAKNALAPESSLFVFSDAARTSQDEEKVEETRQMLRKIKGFREVHVIERSVNLGLATSIIEGTTEIFKKFDTVIVLEDDLVSAPNMLNFMNDALVKYQYTPEIFSVSAYNFPFHVPVHYTYDVYLSYRFLSWGWATWRDRWQKADWEIKDYHAFISDRNAQIQFNKGGEDLTRMLQRQREGKINSWAVRWSYAHYKHNAYALVPVVSKIKNIGADDSGTHVEKTSRYDVLLDDGKKSYHLPDHIALDPVVTGNFQKFFKKSWLRKLLSLILEKFK